MKRKSQQKKEQTLIEQMNNVKDEDIKEISKDKPFFSQEFIDRIFEEEIEGEPTPEEYNVEQSLDKICIYNSKSISSSMGAAIVKHWDQIELNKKASPVGKVEDNITWNTNIEFYDWNYGDYIPDLSDFKTVIMVGVSFPKEKMDQLILWFGKNFIYINHIDSPEKEIKNAIVKNIKIEGLQSSIYGSCQLAWMYFFGHYETNPTVVQNKSGIKLTSKERKRIESFKMPEIVRLIGKHECKEYESKSEKKKATYLYLGVEAYMTDYSSCYDLVFGSRVLSNNMANFDTFIFYGKIIYD